MKFTKSQQRRIDSCSGEREKQNWIDHFAHINEMKQSPEHKEFMKQERDKEKRYQS